MSSFNTDQAKLWIEQWIAGKADERVKNGLSERNDARWEIIDKLVSDHDQLASDAFTASRCIPWQRRVPFSACAVREIQQTCAESASFDLGWLWGWLHDEMERISPEYGL